MPRQTKNPIVLLALSPAATATALGVQPRDVYGAIESGVLPVYRIGAKSRVLVSDVEAWVRSWKRKATKNA